MPADDESVLSRPAPEPDLTVAYGDDRDQIAGVRLGDPARPLLIIVHGGFWRPRYDRAHTGPMAEALRAAGWTTAAIEYRRVPGDPAVTLADVRQAVETLPALVTRHDGRVILIGHSAGGQLVLWAAATGAPHPVVALAPVADLRRAEELHLGGGAVRAFLGGPAEERADIDPMRLPSVPAGIVILHGRSDATVPVALSESYAARHHAELIAPERAHHYSFVDPLDPAWPVLIAELTRRSGPG